MYFSLSHTSIRALSAIPQPEKQTPGRSTGDAPHGRVYGEDGPEAYLQDVLRSTVLASVTFKSTQTSLRYTVNHQPLDNVIEDLLAACVSQRSTRQS